MNKSQILTASRAGLRSAVVTNAGTTKVQVISDIGVVTSVRTGGVFIAQPWP